MAISGALRQYDLQQYNEWAKARDALRGQDRQVIWDIMRHLPKFPTISLVLLPSTNEAASASQATIAAASRQLYPHWELWLPSQTVVTSGDPRLRPVSNSVSIPCLATEEAGEPSLRRLVCSGESTDATRLFNTALAVAEGEFILPLPSGITFPDHALVELATAIGHHPTVDLLYTDEDHLNAEGKHCYPHFKTDWDPDLMLGRDAVGLLVAYRKTHLHRLGGMRSTPGGIALVLYELALRAGVATSPNRIHHIPAVLCHRPVNSEISIGWDPETAREIVHQHLTSRGIKVRVEPAPLTPAFNRIIRDVPPPLPLVSVIVPTRDHAELLEWCVDALLNRTNYSNLELLIIDNDSREPTAIDLLQRFSQHSKVRILPYPGPFNYSAINNFAARQACGEILVLLNNDTDVIETDWLHELVSHAVRPDVGAVGAKLLYPNGQIQHAGVVLQPGLGPTHQFRFANRLDAGPSSELALTRSLSAVTAACLALRRSVFFEVGGLDETLGVAFNDIDLCLRIGDRGYRIVWTPFAQLFHLESESRGYDTTPEQQALAAKEFQRFSRLWAGLLDADPFRSPNLNYGWDTATLSPPQQSVRPGPLMYSR